MLIGTHIASLKANNLWCLTRCDFLAEKYVPQSDHTSHSLAKVIEVCKKIIWTSSGYDNSCWVDDNDDDGDSKDFVL